MKNIIIILLAILSFTPNKAKAQIDSASIKINLSVQARDAEYIASFGSFNRDYEEFFDVTKAKFRVTTYPSGNTVVTVDNVAIREWLLVMAWIRLDPIAIQAGVFSRLDVLLRAKNNAYINRILDEGVAFDTARYNAARLDGRRNLRKAIN